MFLKPGLHHGREGGCDVVWFDPGLLDLSARSEGGLEYDPMLKGSPEQTSAGMRQYRGWQTRRSLMIEQGKRPAFEVLEATKAGSSVSALREPVRIKVESLERSASGRKFGRILHRMMQNATLPVKEENLRTLAAAYGRAVGGSDEDAGAAVRVAMSLFQHEILRSAFTATCVHRELPVAVRLQDGRLVEGRADLVFFDGERWTVVDFKTGSSNNRDDRQVALYARALELAKGQPVRAVILEI